MASKPTSTLSSARKYVRKHGSRVMEYQMEGIVTSPLNLLFVIKPGLNLTALTVTDLCINCLMLVGNLLKWHKVYTLFPQQTKNVAVSRKRVDLLSVFCQYYSHSDPSQLLQLDLVLILLNNWLGCQVRIVWFSIVLGFTNGRTTGPSSDSAATSMPEKAWHLNPGVLSRQNSGLEKW